MGKREEDEATGGGLDDLFGADNFREYDDSINPFVAPPPTAPVRVVAPDHPLPAEESAPIHDRFSATVAMPVVEASGAPSGEETLAMPITARADAAPATGDSPTAEGSAAARQSGGSLWARLGTRARVLVGVGGGAALALLLAGLYALGTALGGGADAATADGAGAAASVTALEPGMHPWGALQGGECLGPGPTKRGDPDDASAASGGAWGMDSVWAEEFTVVECDVPHTGQFLYRGEVGPEVTVYLDAEGWQGLTTTLCDAGELLDLDAASAITDLQWQLTYAGDATEWANGDRSYGCFVSRTSGEPLTGSLLAG